MAFISKYYTESESDWLRRTKDRLRADKDIATEVAEEFCDEWWHNANIIKTSQGNTTIECILANIVREAYVERDKAAIALSEAVDKLESSLDIGKAVYKAIEVNEQFKKVL